MLHPHLDSVLLTADDIQARVRTMAHAIDADFAEDDRVHLVCVLKGAFMFLADLVRAMSARVTVDFIAVSSYAASTTSSGEVRVLKDLDARLQGRGVVIVEDIVDTGLTLRYLQALLRTRSPRVLRTACLLNKPSRRQVDVAVDYVGFDIPDRFVVGYGLDFNDRFRGLPYIATLAPANVIRERRPPAP